MSAIYNSRSPAAPPSSFAAIAAATGFSSVHYFSRTFRALVGMSPREYLRSVQSMTVLPPQERPDS